MTLRLLYLILCRLLGWLGLLARGPPRTQRCCWHLSGSHISRGTNRHSKATVGRTARQQRKPPHHLAAADRAVEEPCADHRRLTTPPANSQLSTHHRLSGHPHAAGAGAGSAWRCAGSALAAARRLSTATCYVRRLISLARWACPPTYETRSAARWPPPKAVLSHWPQWNSSPPRWAMLTAVVAEHNRDVPDVPAFIHAGSARASHIAGSPRSPTRCRSQDSPLPSSSEEWSNLFSNRPTSASACAYIVTR
jgi:hypothetical protein